MKNKLTTTFKRSVTALAVATAFSVATPALADNVNGAIKGTIVTQNASASLAGATITVINEKNGYKRELIADENGQFDIKTIPTGKYNLTISKAGYETAQVKDVIIGIGKTAFIEIPLTVGELEVISVVGAAINVVDVSVSESAFNITAEELEILPIARSVTSVALLAPGTVKGDSRFGDLASFGGSSVAENTYYVNGLNMTNFRNGTGGADIPFSAYDNFQIKTGGYSAEFGRSTGGVISGVTKSGTNEFEFGVEAIYKPSGLWENSPNTLYQQNDCNANGECDHLLGDIFINREDTERSNFETNVTVAGPIIEDTLFFYGVYRFRDFENDTVNSTQTRKTEFRDDDPFWLARIDWHINEDHSLMFWGFKDERTRTTTTFSKENDQFTNNLGVSNSQRGGTSYAARYTGYLTDDFIMTAMYGEVEFSEIDQSENDSCPVIYDADGRGSIGCWVNFQVGEKSDTRKQYRVDFEWTVNDDHTLRFGYDGEKNTAEDLTYLSGNVYYRYETFDAGARLPNGYVFDETTRTTRVRNYQVGGSFDINNWSIYLEDQWQVTDNLRLNLGIRSDSFENLNAEGKEFISIDYQIAPRLGMSWDINGDGNSKLYANLGRYYLPVAANTNVRLAGGETYTHDYYVYEGENADFTPTGLSQKLGDTVVFGDGTTKSADTLVDKDIEPMYNDEIMIGYQAAINDEWSWGVKFTRRELGRQIDDGSAEIAFKNAGFDDDHFILFNPGKAVRFNYDLDGDGVAEELSYTAEEMGYPKAERKYSAVDVKLERAWNDDWTVNLTYTWSKNYGNAEGYVKSDNGQDDAGLTTDWDYPYLMDGAYGDLPSDRRHVIKAFGAYRINDSLVLGINATASSGRPWTALGTGYTPDQDQYHYGDTYWVGDRQFSRGEMGRTPWEFDVNLSLTYNTQVLDNDLRIAVDVFNVFDAAGIRRYNEEAEVAVGQSSATFGLPTSYQPARSIQLTASYTF